MGDEGLEIACEGFQTALSPGLLKLEELNLSENELTVRSLRALGRVVQVAEKDLRGLDLSGNSIKVESEEEQAIWEGFLRSFWEVIWFSLWYVWFLTRWHRCLLCDRLISQGIQSGLEVWKSCGEYMQGSLPFSFLDGGCRKSHQEMILRLLTMPMSSLTQGLKMQKSSTSRLGDSAPPAAHERLRCQPLCQPRPPRTAGMILVCDVSDCFVTFLTDLVIVANSDNLGDSQSERPILISRPKRKVCGLRSVPYFNLRQTEGGDAGALFISYLIEFHHTPQRLLSHLPKTKPGTSVEHLKVDLLGISGGILYSPNDTVSSIGMRMMELADKTGDSTTPPSRSSSHRKSENSVPLLCRRNAASGTQANHGPELERARNKVQGTILKDSGISACQLWCNAIKIFSLSRTLFLSSTGCIPWQDWYLEGSREIRAGVWSLPEDAWINIIQHVSDPEGLLSTRQCVRIIAWAQDLQTLQKEMELTGKLRSLQLWRALESVGCLSYE